MLEAGTDRRHPRRPCRGAATLFAGALLGAALATALAPAAAAALTCATVTRKHLPDPAGSLFASRFRDPVAVDAAGNVLFAARPKFDFEKLYLAAPDGTLSVVAATFGPAPNDSVFAGNIPFRRLSLNAAGDLAFLGRTARGRAVVVRRGTGPLELAASANRPSPFDEVRWQSIVALSDIDDDAVVVFAADLADGRHGLFSYDAGADSHAVVHLAGSPTDTGRELCEFEEVDLSDGGDIVFLADTRLECDDDGEPIVPGVFLSKAGTVETVLHLGDATPIPGATYLRIVHRPEIAANGDVLLHVRLGGTGRGEALFVRDAATGVVARVARAGDPLPGGGVIRALREAHLADDGSVVAHVKVGGGTERFGLYRWTDGTAEPVLVGSDAPPADLLTPPSRWAAFAASFGLSPDGGGLGVVAKVRDGARPRFKAGVFRCGG